MREDRIKYTPKKISIMEQARNTYLKILLLQKLLEPETVKETSEYHNKSQDQCVKAINIKPYRLYLLALEIKAVPIVPP